MHHIGKQEFYDDVSYKIDSLQQKGYTVFYEQVTLDKNMDSVIKDNYSRKFRKLIGLNGYGYYDTLTGVVSGKYKYKGKEKLVNQPRLAKLITNLESAVNADVELNEVIDIFEIKYGKIELNECDLNTAFRTGEYKCGKVNKKLRDNFRKDFVLKYRNENLAREITNTTQNNIVVVYGKAHAFGLYLELIEIDKNWSYWKSI